MLETVLKANQRGRWAVSLRMKPTVFSWAVLKAGEQQQPVSTFINEFLERAAVADLKSYAETGSVV